MFLANIVLAACSCLAINHVFVRSHQLKMRQSNLDAEEEEEEEKKEEIVDVHTFVALVDIIFTDYSKRTCTGTIIHDNVVITAAHCFYVVGKPELQPELTASFVVIGTKKMFETGYEQYLPIERVISHPEHDKWTADIALVYTFSGMTSDKPGTVIPLEVEKTSTLVDSNITVLSWGVCFEDDLNDDRVTKMDKFEGGNKNVKKAPYKDKSSYEGENEDCDSGDIGRALRSGYKARKDTADMSKTAKRPYRKPLFRYTEMHRFNEAISTQPTPKTLPPFTTRYQSRYLSSGESETAKENYRGPSSSPESNSSPESDRDNSTHHINYKVKEHYNTRKTWFKAQTQKKYGYKSLYHNWRRSMGSQHNKLTVDVFGFVNMQACRKMVEKAMPAYDIRESNDIVCYASDEHYITEEDSGAPAIRAGHLVAVTVSGVDCDNDHVAIGVKMSCYCSWVVQNLPSGAPHMKCCKNCCDQTIPGDRSEPRHRYHKMHLI